MELNIDRSLWKKVKLGDVAYEYSERINDPSTSIHDKFVGSSNIGRWDFRITSFESTDSVTSAMKLFRENDYLLVRRSLYASDFRERAPRAQFSGVCSGDILTIRENPECIADGFLVGILNSPRLWKYVVANASGSITRRIKWRDLAKYEFLLPPKDQQAELAELLWAAEDISEKNLETKNRLSNYYEVSVNNSFDYKNKESLAVLSSIAKINHESLSIKTAPDFKFNYLDLSCIISPKVLGPFNSTYFRDAPSRARRIVADNSIILATVRPYQKHFVHVERANDLIASTGTAVVNLNNQVLTRYVFHQFFTQHFELYCANRMNGTNYPAITSNDIGQFKVYLPNSLDEIKSVSFLLDSIERAIGIISQNIIESSALKQSIINQIF